MRVWLTCGDHCFPGQDVLGAVVEAYAWRQAALWIVGPLDIGSWIGPCRMLSHAGSRDHVTRQLTCKPAGTRAHTCEPPVFVWVPVALVPQRPVACSGQDSCCYSLLRKASGQGSPNGAAEITRNHQAHQNHSAQSGIAAHTVAAVLPLLVVALQQHVGLYVPRHNHKDTLLLLRRPKSLHVASTFRRPLHTALNDTTCNQPGPD